MSFISPGLEQGRWVANRSGQTKSTGPRKGTRGTWSTVPAVRPSPRPETSPESVVSSCGHWPSDPYPHVFLACHARIFDGKGLTCLSTTRGKGVGDRRGRRAGVGRRGRRTLLLAMAGFIYSWIVGQEGRQGESGHGGSSQWIVLPALWRCTANPQFYPRIAFSGHSRFPHVPRRGRRVRITALKLHRRTPLCATLAASTLPQHTPTPSTASSRPFKSTACHWRLAVVALHCPTAHSGLLHEPVYGPTRRRCSDQLPRLSMGHG